MGYIQGRIQDFKLGGAHLKKLRRPEEGAEQISTESFLDFQIASKPSIKIETPETAEFIWSILKNLTIPR
jgi:hypothetical protein